MAAKASPRARYSAIGAILAAGATLAWMMLASEETACQSGPTRPSSYVEPSSVFLPWLAFVVAATMLAVVHNRLALDVPWVKRWSLVTLIAAVVLCPIGPLFMLSVMNCGM